MCAIANQAVHVEDAATIPTTGLRLNHFGIKELSLSSKMEARQEFSQPMPHDLEQCCDA
jgi:hypothetical protein